MLDRLTYPNLSGIPTDAFPVTPDDDNDNAGAACIGVYVTVGGNVRVTTLQGFVRDIPVGAQSPLPMLVRRIHATGTTATGIFALQG